MNLYEVVFAHYAPKDSQRGIVAYLVGNTDEDVYNWLKSEPKLSDDRWIYVSYEDNEADSDPYEIYNDDYEVIGEESFKERMIRLKGEINDEDVELSDLYYGKTLYGWKLVKEDVKPDVLQIMKDSGVGIEKAIIE